MDRHMSSFVVPERSILFKITERYHGKHRGKGPRGHHLQMPHRRRRAVRDVLTFLFGEWAVIVGLVARLMTPSY